MKKFIVILALLTLPTAAAQADDSWYVSAGVGMGILADAELDDPTGVLAFLASEVTHDAGVGFSGAFGYRWNKFRLEGEIAYDVNDVDQVQSGLFGVGFTGSGETDSLSFMLNAWRDFPVSDSWSVNAGAGLGLAIISFNDVAFLGAALPDDSDMVFAYQFGTGLGYAISRDATLTFDYKIFSTLDPEFTSGGVPWSSEYFLHRLRAGTRMDF